MTSRCIDDHISKMDSKNFGTYRVFDYDLHDLELNSRSPGGTRSAVSVIKLLERINKSLYESCGRVHPYTLTERNRV